MQARKNVARPLSFPAEATTDLPLTQLPSVEQFQQKSFRSLRSAIAPKILLYSHDTFGLGNIRRTLLLAQELIDQYPNAAILLITGSQMIHSFRIPEGIDYIKLPCLDRVDAEHYESRFLTKCSNEIKRTRSAIIEHSVLGFAPDVMIVDKRPAGVDGELISTLEALRQHGMPTKLILGVRDILDEPEKTRRTLRQNQSFETIERYYDEVWIYGSKAIFDTVKEYDFPASVAAITQFCGYLKRPTRTQVPTGGPPQVLVTTGGGGDGGEMIEAYLDGLSRLPRNVAINSTVVFGPQMSDTRRNSLLERYGYLADVTFLDFAPDLTPLYAQSDIVVSMAGYNTVCELLSFGRHAILCPRATPVSEQLIRARLLAAEGLFDLIEPENLNGDVLMQKVLAALKPVEVRSSHLDLEGLPRIRERLRLMLEETNS